MTTEFMSLFIFCATVLTIILAQVAAVARTHGMGYILGNRDGMPEQDDALVGRLTRALANSMETAPVFVALVLMAAHLGVSNPMTQWGAVLFAGARVVHPMLYAAGVTGARSMVWNIALLSLVALGYGILAG